MAEINCRACEDLRQEVPQLLCDGFDESMCTSLKNDTGLAPSSGHNDCTDLNNMNDCLVGNMEAEVDLYEVCDWKTFMKNFIPNLWTTFKAVICAICGIWTNIHNLWTKVNKLINDLDKLSCVIDYMNKGKDFDIGEEPSAGSYVVAGKGCSFLGPKGTDEHATDLHLRYVAGGFGILNCSVDFHQSNFTDVATCYNYDNNGRNPQNTKSRLGNSEWGQDGKPAVGGELVYEIRIKKSQYPQLKSLFGGRGQASMGSAFFSSALVFNEGTWAYGQHGACHTQNGSGYSAGDPYKDGYSYGHQVPTGWIYVQCRIDWIDQTMVDGNQYTPTHWMGIRLNPNAIDC